MSYLRFVDHLPILTATGAYADFGSIEWDFSGRPPMGAVGIGQRCFVGIRHDASVGTKYDLISYASGRMEYKDGIVDERDEMWFLSNLRYGQSQIFHHPLAPSQVLKLSNERSIVVGLSLQDQGGAPPHGVYVVALTTDGQSLTHGAFQSAYEVLPSVWLDREGGIDVAVARLSNTSFVVVQGARNASNDYGPVFFTFDASNLTPQLVDTEFVPIGNGNVDGTGHIVHVVRQDGNSAVPCFAFVGGGGTTMLDIPGRSVSARNKLNEDSGFTTASSWVMHPYGDGFMYSSAGGSSFDSFRYATYDFAAGQWSAIQTHKLFPTRSAGTILNSMSGVGWGDDAHSIVASDVDDSISQTLLSEFRIAGGSIVGAVHHDPMLDVGATQVAAGSGGPYCIPVDDEFLVFTNRMTNPNGYPNDGPFPENEPWYVLYKRNRITGRLRSRHLVFERS